jgi:hypothetical protein
MTRDELMVQLRKQAIEGIGQVKGAWIEADGSVSVIRRWSGWSSDQASAARLSCLARCVHSTVDHEAQGASLTPPMESRREIVNIFYIIGVVVVVLFVLGYFGLR